MEVEAFAGCDGHHILNASFPHWEQRRRLCAAAVLMLEYQAKLSAAATSARLLEPSHGRVGRVLLINSKRVTGPACPGPR
jgi:hypothetical protein